MKLEGVGRVRVNIAEQIGTRGQKLRSLPKSRRIWNRTIAYGSAPILLSPTFTESGASAKAGWIKTGPVMRAMARVATLPLMSVFMFPSSMSRTIVREFVHQQTGRKTAACIAVPKDGMESLTENCSRSGDFLDFRWPRP